MSPENNDSSRDIWAKIHIVSDILGKLLIPVVVVIISLIWSSHQKELLQKEAETNIELKHLEIFYRDITSKDFNRRKIAMGILKEMKPDLALRLMSVLDDLTIERGVELSNKLAADQSQPDYIRSKAESIRFSLLDKFRITTPSDGDSVDFFDLIQGKTPFKELNHYIVITPLRTGDDFIQDKPAIVSSTGLWSGRTKFGTANVGKGEKYSVRVIATKSVLSSGSLTQSPEDVFSSNSITVIRKRR